MQPTTETTLEQRIAAIRDQIAAACERAGRDPSEVTLVGVTKTYPTSAAAAAMQLGLGDFGENRAQELMPKVHEAASIGLAPRWHFIGHLQRNKVREVLPHIVALHSLDSLRLIEEIDRAAAAGATPPPPRCYLEVNVSGEQSKQGIPPGSLPELLARALASPHIQVAGLMTVAPQVAEREQVRPVFRALRELAQAHGLTGLSMGMSEDFPVAIEEGATVVRVGRAIFGPRPE